jgi:hypothetical protein
MDREVFEQRLASLGFREEAKTTALVEEFRRDLTEVQRTLLRYLQAGGGQAQRAHSVLSQLGETAVETLVSTVATQKPVPSSSLLIALTQGVLVAESAVTARLKSVLTDTRLVPQLPAMQALEEVGPPYRVCDEAYVGLRRVLSPESYMQFLMESRHFLALPEAARNQEIESWRKSGTFTRFLEDVDDEEG